MLLLDFIRKSLVGRKILLTGGTGFFGRNILLYILKNNITVENLTVLTRNANKFKQTYLEFKDIPFLTYIEGNITNFAILKSNYDYIIHGATSIVDKIESKQLLNDIIDGTKRILEFAVNSNVRSMINISSGAVYGHHNHINRISEDYPNYPTIESVTSSYGLGKLISEHYCYLASTHKLKVTSIRCFCFGGPYLDNNHYVLGYLIKQALKNENMKVKSGNGIYRSYLSTIDLVEWMLYLLIISENREKPYGCYNVGSEEAYTIPELAYKVKDILNSTSEITCPNLNKDKAIEYYVPDIQKIKQLGLSCNFNLKDIVLDTAKYYNDCEILEI